MIINAVKNKIFNLDKLILKFLSKSNNNINKIALIKETENPVTAKYKNNIV